MYPEKSVKVYILVWNPVFDISRDRKADTVTGTGSYLFGNDVSSSYSGTGAAGSVALLYRFATFVLPFVIGAVVVVLWRRVHRSTEKAA